ncbi:unnamed protein product [Lymnaea stagnalis]|uniref:Amine oxidase n=1 Tax=Lymnaea stagnalis TaxID=6523 RepID=A0AAV2GXQ3_LYMST
MKMQLLATLVVLLLLAISIVPNNGTKEKVKNKKKEVPVQKKEPPKKVDRKDYPGLPKEVLIIGAGMAGLAAARRISSDRSNFTVKVYEARQERFGGRVWTDKLKDMSAKGAEVDLGGSAFNVVSKNNPLVKLAEDFELKSTKLDNLQFIVPWEQKHFSGEELTQITRQAGQILGQALNESKSVETEISVKEAIDKVLASGAIASSDSPGALLIKSLPSYILRDYSTRNYTPELLDVGYEKVLLDGMGELVDRLLSGSPEEPPLHLHLNKAVRQIKVDKSQGKVLVRFRDGSQVSADFVVVAVPSTIISTGGLLFEPALPKKYQLAAKEMGMSAGDKIIIQFERPFWSPDYGVFVRAVNRDSDRGNLQTWVNINRIVGVPALGGFLTGDPAVKFEKMTNEDAEELVITVLNEMFGEEVVKQGGKIVKFQRSQWVTDEWSKGASTYPKVGNDPSLWDTFSQPLCPYIYFAGEHTQFDSHGSLHGAYNSGIRAGDQILTGLCELLRKEEIQRKKEERRKKEEAKKKKEGDKADKKEGKKSKEDEIKDDEVDDDDYTDDDDDAYENEIRLDKEKRDEDKTDNDKKKKKKKDEL